MLYCENELDDQLNVLAAIDGFADGLDLGGAIEIDQRAITEILRGMRQDFPAVGGSGNASPFKKAANFLCYFVANSPIRNPFPAAKVGDDIVRIPNHQNAMVGLHIAIDSLHDASIHRDDGVIALDNRIELSKHSYVDIIQACRNLAPQTHFHIASVLLEQMCYRTNPNASYPTVI